MSFLDPILNPILIPLLNKSPILTVLLLSLFISFLVTLVYKYATNQQKMKELKDKQKEFQDKMKELKGNPQEMLSAQKEAMKTNMEYMKHSFKATFITMLPILLIFSWMTAHLSYEPLFPDRAFNVQATFAQGVEGVAQLLPNEGLELQSNKTQAIIFPSEDKKEGIAIWKLKGGQGEHNFTIQKGEVLQQKTVLITTQPMYEQPLTTYSKSDIKSIQVEHSKLKPLGDTSIFGWEPGWLGLYIISSLIFSLLLRKLMHVY